MGGFTAVCSVFHGMLGGVTHWNVPTNTLWTFVPHKHICWFACRWSNDRTARKVGYFHLLSMCVKGNGFVLWFALCCVLCLAGRCIELRMLKLYELLFLVGTSVDLVAMEQRQDNKKGRFFSFVKQVWARKWGLYCSLHCAEWYARRADARNCAC